MDAASRMACAVRQCRGQRALSLDSGCLLRAGWARDQAADQVFDVVTLRLGGVARVATLRSSSKDLSPVLIIIASVETHLWGTVPIRTVNRWN